MEEFEKIECKGCERGIKMCEQRPCWGTVEDLRKIIDAGHSKSLMLDFWGNPDITNIDILCGALVGYEGQYSPFSPHGACTFLKNNLCSINELKPLEGATACCKSATREISDREREYIKDNWDTDAGRALVAEWKGIVGLTGERPMPDIFDMLQLMKDTFGIKRKYDEN